MSVLCNSNLRLTVGHLSADAKWSCGDASAQSYNHSSEIYAGNDMMNSLNTAIQCQSQVIATVHWEMGGHLSEECRELTDS